MRRVVAWAVTWQLPPALSALAIHRDASLDASDAPLIAALIACWLVGVVITGRAPEQPAGWAFLGLGTALSWSVFCDSFSDNDVLATFGDTSFAWWFVFLALILQFTPPTGRSRVLPWLTVAGGGLFQVMALLRSTPLDPPLEHIVSPFSVEAISGPAKTLAALAIYTVAGCLVASVGVLVRAWRRSEGAARQQLLWLVAGSVPVAPAVIGAFVASWADAYALASVLLGVAMTTLVAGAGLSVLRYRLYDVERVVTESAAYAIASASVILAFVTVVVVVSRSTPLDAGSTLATVAATLAGVVVARVSFVWGRRAVGRRVNPTRFDALEVLRAGLATAALDDLVVHALGSHARVLYPAGSGWVTSDGRAVTPGQDAVDVHRKGVLTARLEYDPAESDRSVADAVAAEAAAEIDNVALRAELARQVELITQSRSRIATAHLDERRRIERDLHDGAQQRLLAIALQLRAARMNADPVRLDAEADRAIDDLQTTVRELRDLAAGLLPAALAGGGLLPAVAEMAARSPITLTYDVVDQRFPSALEGAAWFVLSEAVTNVVKHSDAQAAVIEVRLDDGLRVSVIDEGAGGADPAGSGLQGLADRVSATGGFLSVEEVLPHGTKVEAVFPCAS